MESPLCPICCDKLGERGGPTTLPCGHNGCFLCLLMVQQHRSECPLCRSPFDPNMPLVVNTQLRDLIKESTQFFVDENDRANGWEAFPTKEMTSAHYAAQMRTNQNDSEPSAPPLDSNLNMDEFQPPQWMPDSSSEFCMACSKPFLPFIRHRHHCRMCGCLFCDACSNRRLLLPEHFKEKAPQRVCEMCRSVLEPLQSELQFKKSRTQQAPVHDMFDWCSARSWINGPYSGSMEQDIFRATNVVRTFQHLVQSFPKVVPQDILQSAKGVIILSEVKVAFGFLSCRMGTGLAIARLEDRRWGRPCSLASASFGVGLQIGGQLVDAIIILPDQGSVEAIAGNTQICSSGGASAAFGMGPGLGGLVTFRVGEGTGSRLGTGFCFCICRGAFFGVALEGAVLTHRPNIHREFYGSEMTPRELLLEDPNCELRSMSQLHRHLNDLFDPSEKYHAFVPNDRGYENLYAGASL